MKLLERYVFEKASAVIKEVMYNDNIQILETSEKTKSIEKEEKKVIIPQMTNYLEKYRPDKALGKFKVRVLNRGDKQILTGEIEGPVTRVG